MARLQDGTRIYGTATIDTILYVNSPAGAISTTTGALQVTGGAGIGGGLYVGGVSTFTNKLVVPNTTVSTSTTTGALTVEGGAGIGGGLYVGGVSTFTNKLVVSNTTVSTSTTTGALQVAGGVGVGGGLYVGDTVTAPILTAYSGVGSSPLNISSDGIWKSSSEFYISGGGQAGPSIAGYSGIVFGNGGPLDLYGGSGGTRNINLRTGATGAVVVTNTSATVSTTTGALQVAGGVGVGGDLNVGGTVTATVLRTLSTEIALGDQAGAGQGLYAVAIGSQAGNTSQASQAIAIGYGAGLTSQKANAVAIGVNAGFNNQGANAIAIGAGAGSANQPAGSIIFNADSASNNLNAANTGTYISPIRTDATTSATTYGVYYNPETKELTTATSLTNILKLTVSASAPAGATTGTFAVADRVNWDPASKITGNVYPVFYDGSVWNALY